MTRLAYQNYMKKYQRCVKGVDDNIRKVLDYAGVSTPDYMQGRSFRSIMETGEEPVEWKQAAYYHYWMHMASHDNPGHIAIRTKKHKLIFFYGCKQNDTVPETPPGWELYDLEQDPGEMNNLYDDPAQADVITALKKELKAMRASYGEDNPEFACNAVIEEFWDYGPEQRARAIEISHQYKMKRERVK